jgi:DNA-binding transcriptional LysR family regulator
MPRAVYASPAYVAEHGAPRTPAELSEHNCLAFTLLPTPNAWTFSKAGKAQGKQTTIAITGNASSNSSEAIREMVLAGMGISQSPTWQFEEDLAAGRVVQLLQNHRSPSLAINAVFSGRRQSARVAAFVDYIIASMPPAA